MAKRKVSPDDTTDLDKLTATFTSSGQSFKQVSSRSQQSEVFLNRLTVK